MEKAIQDALNGILEPVSGQSILSSGLISDISLKDQQLRIIIELPANYTGQLLPERKQIEDALKKIDGIEKVAILLTSHQEAAKQTVKPMRPIANITSIRPPNIGLVICVASGKGGVGKSTIAFNIATALARAGKKIGLLDADIYGPSVPTLMGRAHDKCSAGDDGKIIPAFGHGLKAMSMGFIVEKGQSLAWRGPMVTKALTQLFQGVDWGELDYLIIDMPPGTGDVQLSLAQQARIDGAIMVSTPQEVALADVRRGASMFEKVGVKIIGMVENMSLLVDEATGTQTDLFGRGGAKIAAQELNIPFLGEVFFHPALRLASDDGTGTPNVAALQFDKLAQALLAN